jgi:hypothetical protein
MMYTSRRIPKFAFSLGESWDAHLRLEISTLVIAVIAVYISGLGQSKMLITLSFTNDARFAQATIVMTNMSSPRGQCTVNENSNEQILNG